MENQDLHSFHISTLIQKVTSEGMCIVSPEQNIAFCNQAMAGIFGFASTNDLLNLPYHKLYADHQEFLLLSKKLDQQRVLTRERVLLVRKDSSIFWAHINGKQISYNNEIFSYFTLKDISERIKNEEFVRARTLALEKVNTEFDRFIYSASHDLRAPISTIKGLVNLMKIDGEQARYDQLIDLMDISLNKLDNFIQNLTYFGRNKFNGTKSTKINFKKIVSRVQERISDHRYFNLIDFRSQFQLSSAPFYSSRFRIELIIEEIIRNAYDFHDLSKESPYISLAIREGNMDVQIVVEDNGTGIPNTYINSVFDIFYRASTLSTGAGIGLFITQEAVNKLRGTISLTSEPGIGTTVTLTLPFLKKAAT